VRIPQDLQSAAKNGQLKTFPKHFLTRSNLEYKDRKNRSIIQIAAEFRHLNQIPKDIFTRENITEYNSFQYSVLHYAARESQIKEIPTELLTRDILSNKDEMGRSVYHLLVRNNALKSLPSHLLKEHDLLLKDRWGDTPLDYATAKTSQTGKISPQINLVLKNVSTKTLTEQQKKLYASDNKQLGDKSHMIELIERELSIRNMLNKIGKNEFLEI
jgi:hypothetical protein